MTEMYGSYSDEDLNEWERMPQNIRVLTSSAFGAWLLRRDKRIKEREPKAGHWEYTDAYPHWVCCDKCGIKFIPNREWIKAYNIPTNYCPNCGAKMESEG